MSSWHVDWSQAMQDYWLVAICMYKQGFGNHHNPYGLRLGKQQLVFFRYFKNAVMICIYVMMEFPLIFVRFMALKNGHPVVPMKIEHSYVPNLATYSCTMHINFTVKYQFYPLTKL